ncbi:MAG: hypothetical protein JWM31_660 [Solirubrobacterales bacterium]|nr:hypothetical protein [Solirubrobacterales bacterium]
MTLTRDYSALYDPDTDFDRHFTHATGRRIRRWFRPGDRVLEFGCATGLMTSILTGTGRVTVDALERSPEYVERARARNLEAATIHHGSIFDWRPPGPFQHVVAAHLVNELPDPAAFLEHCREQLAPGGLLHVSLTNPRSLHRLVAREMGLIKDLAARSDRGERFQTVEIFDDERLEQLGREAGLTCVHREGVIVKPLTNAQMADLDDDVIEGFDRLARLLPQHGAINYLIFVDERDA